MVWVLFAELEYPDTFLPVDRYISALPASLQRKVRSYRYSRDAQLCLFGKLLLRKAAGHLGYEEDILHAIRFTEFDRPYVEGPVDFNISHSGSCVVVALSDSGRVGIDIEEVGEVSLSDFQDYFTEAEYRAILRSEHPRLSFYQWWTRKESLMKADGRGMNLPPREIIIEGHTADIQGCRWYLTVLPLLKNYVSFLATDQLICSDNLRIRRVNFN